MKPQTNHEWWDFYTNYCREKFRKNIHVCPLKIVDGF